ncbi:alanine/glycine:cation symporter family protein [Shewanella surugensis]|uniref:Alanine:cation symporter family protein n=1 Tax=Shewanella surugensis TaxID=212020 RepID=A0ABT0LJH3_9GAMM|nr:alanine/glycine:cation symporter family protein [Shewanella surugensis]MCL1127862.1 alanine:cation symporter family protein [Shewanella surugensis]
MTTIESMLSILFASVLNYLLIFVLLTIGIYFSYQIRFTQINKIRHMLALLLEQAGFGKNRQKRISSFSTFCIPLASRVGAGNFAGVGIAISLGGAGAVFWMWMIAFIGAASCLIENTLAQAYKRKLKNGRFMGGPAVYIAFGLKSRKMALLFSILMVISYGLIFNLAQSNTIAGVMEVAFSVSPLSVGINLAVFTGVIIFGSLSGVLKITQILFPIASCVYLMTAIVVMIMNYQQIIPMLLQILEEALGFKQASAGTFGIMVVQGIKRGVFSNEAGMGSTPNAGAIAYVSHPVKQGFIQALGVLTTTLILSTATAFIILVSQINYISPELTGIDLIYTSMDKNFGEQGGSIIALLIFIFVYSTVVVNYFYGETNIKYITRSPLVLTGFRCSVLLMVILGAVLPLGFVWQVVDFFVAILAFINIWALVSLRKVALKLFKNYMQQLQQGKDPIFHKETIPELHHVECWGDADYKVFQAELKAKKHLNIKGEN